MRFFKKHIAILSIGFFYLVLFLPVVGQVHLFDWDEINFAEAAREMIVTGDWFNVQINYEPFWEKPPLFIWLQAISFSILGVSEFAARLPNVIIGLVTIIVVFRFVVKRYGQQAAILSCVLYLGSITPHFYFKSGIIDPLFNLLMFLSVLYLIISFEKKSTRYFFLAGLMLGLSVMTKGPVAILLVGLTGLVYQLVYKVHFYSFKSLIFLALGLMLPLALYFGKQWHLNGSWFITEFVSYQVDLFKNPVASHGQPFYYHAIVLLIGCFPLMLLAIPSLTRNTTLSGDQNPLRWMKVLFWVVLVVFSLVTTKIVHYSSMCYLPLTMLAGVYYSQVTTINKFLKGAILIVGFVLTVAFTSLNYIGLNGLDRLEEMGFSTALGNWSVFGYVIVSLFFGLLVWLVLRFSKITLVTYAIFNVLIISLLMFYFTPKVEKTIQGNWVNQLKTYQGKEMLHFTQGFKSYAHIFYTKQKSAPEFEKAKKAVLVQNGFESFRSLSRQDKAAFDTHFRTYVIHQTQIPISLSVKLKNREENLKNPALKEVFVGNGYAVFERR